MNVLLFRNMDKFFIINVRNELKKREFLWDTQNNAYMNKEANKNGWLEISKIVNCDARLIERFSIYMKLDLFFNKHGNFNSKPKIKEIRSI